MFRPSSELSAVEPALKIVRTKIAVVGLGYVGLPVAIAFSQQFDVIGFDIDERRVRALCAGRDVTGEVESARLAESSMHITADPADLQGCNYFVVTVPTPVDDGRNPDFTILVGACRLIAPYLSIGSVVIFESTVYPGATDDICGPELARYSGLVCGVDFKLAYSPERINPGDTTRPLHMIVKVVSGQDAETLDRVAMLYGRIISAGIHRASSIKVAEAAKVLENTQRDVNIALMNEMSKICDLVGINTNDVLAAAGTKWNFLNFRPGLVGGHCIGVDPYYLTAKAEQLGYHPEVILSGRRINDGMAAYVANRLIQFLSLSDRPVRRARVGILGITFKENVPDIRNSKVVDVYRELLRFGVKALVHDPIADAGETLKEYGIALCGLDELVELDALVIAVGHDSFIELPVSALTDRLVTEGVLVDIKSIIDSRSIREDLRYWSL